MQALTVTFRILRFKPGLIDPPHNQDFTVRLEPRMTVLDGLEQIRLNLDATLLYRHCCHHASCGTCACTINGTPALACTTRIWQDCRVPGKFGYRLTTRPWVDTYWHSRKSMPQRTRCAYYIKDRRGARKCRKPAT